MSIMSGFKKAFGRGLKVKKSRKGKKKRGLG